jgi:hypothetical protein
MKDFTDLRVPRGHCFTGYCSRSYSSSFSYCVATAAPEAASPVAAASVAAAPVTAAPSGAAPAAVASLSYCSRGVCCSCGCSHGFCYRGCSSCGCYSGGRSSHVCCSLAALVASSMFKFLNIFFKARFFMYYFDIWNRYLCFFPKIDSPRTGTNEVLLVRFRCADSFINLIVRSRNRGSMRIEYRFQLSMCSPLRFNRFSRQPFFLSKIFCDFFPLFTYAMFRKFHKFLLAIPARMEFRYTPAALSLYCREDLVPLRPNSWT